jgi:hypothetical protein
MAFLTICLFAKRATESVDATDDKPEPVVVLVRLRGSGGINLGAIGALSAWATAEHAENNTRSDLTR